MMKNFDAEEVKKIVANHPIKEIRGVFRFNFPLSAWNFGDDIENITQRKSEVKKFFETQETWAVLMTENGDDLGKLIFKYEMFAELPHYSDLYVLNFELKCGDIMTMVLSVGKKFPYFEEGGKFSISLDLN